MAAKLKRFEGEIHISTLDFPEGLIGLERELEDGDIIGWMSKLVVMNMEDDYHLALLDIKNSEGKTNFVYSDDYKMDRAVEALLKIDNGEAGYLLRRYDEALSGMTVERNIQNKGIHNPYQRWYKVGSTQIRLEAGSAMTTQPIVAVEQSHYLGEGVQWPRDIFIFGEHSRKRQLETGFADHSSQANIDEAAQALIQVFNLNVSVPNVPENS